ncbi:MAG: Trm112 family protein [Capsulimonadaceae bacterium]
MILDSKLIEMLACPACSLRPPLRVNGDTLVCDCCRRAYRIRDGIPILLPEEAIESAVEVMKEEAGG